MNHSQSSSRLPPLYPNQPQDPTPLFHSLLLPPLFRTSPSLDLPPKPTKAPWTIAEDKLLKKLMANRLDSWEKIANGFEGRSVHCLKQRWTVLSSLAQGTFFFSFLASFLVFGYGDEGLWLTRNPSPPPLLFCVWL